MSKYGMIIDLQRCMGCNACTIACKVEHNTPNDMHYTKVLEAEVGKFPDSGRIFLPTLCNHCEEPPCVPVCPTRASYRRDDGIVLIDHDRCIGCGACILACPYDQRSPVEDERTVMHDGKTRFVNQAHATVPRGVATKCDFCYHRVDQGRQPACVETCPTRARIFGQWDGGKTPLRAIAAKYKAKGLLAEKGTDPNVLYID
jgi:molybdopterin-containing oxidoreductase family iron-sulfur binding subunit